MKLSVEFKNGFLIFSGIASLFFLMKLIGLEKLGFLRILNVFFVFYGIRKTLATNLKEGVSDFGENILSLIKTAVIGVFLSVVGLYIFIYLNGGQAYLNSLSVSFIFGKNPTVSEYCFSMLFEGVASIVILVLLAMQFWSPSTTNKAVT